MKHDSRGTGLTAVNQRKSLFLVNMIVKNKTILLHLVLHTIGQFHYKSICKTVQISHFLRSIETQLLLSNVYVSCLLTLIIDTGFECCGLLHITQIPLIPRLKLKHIVFARGLRNV